MERQRKLHSRPVCRRRVIVGSCAAADLLGWLCLSEISRDDSGASERDSAIRPSLASAAALPSPSPTEKEEKGTRTAVVLAPAEHSAPVEQTTNSTPARELGVSHSDRFLREAGLHLESFLGDSPNIVGWASVWQRLASEASLVESSIFERNGALLGEFTIDREAILIEFEIGEDGYILKWNDDASTVTEGVVDFRSSLSFARSDVGEIETLHGAVQLRPRPGQLYHKDGPVGYVFRTSSSKSNARPMMPEFKADGSYGITVSGYEEKAASEGGYVDPAYDWYNKLAQVEQSFAKASSKD